MPKIMLSYAAALLLSANAATGLNITVATGEYAPFAGQDIAGYGSVSERLTRYAESAGVTLDFEFLPWKRALEATRRGQYAATSFWYFNENRKQDFIHVGPLVEDRVVFFRRSDTDIGTWENLEDLSGLRIGIVSGYTYTPEFWALVENGTLTVSEGPDDTANMRKLDAGRVDLVPVSEEAGWHMIRSAIGPDSVPSFSTEETPLSITFGYLLVSRATEGAETIAERLQAAIDADPFVAGEPVD